MKRPRLARSETDLDSGQAFFLLSDSLTQGVRRAATACIDAQRRISAVAGLQTGNRERALAAVSEDALQHRLREDEDVHGIATQPEISDVVVINADHIRSAVHDDEVRVLRCELDDEVNRLLRGLIAGGRRFKAIPSGHFWYRPDTHMGWHTNNRAPGWRVYLTYAEQPGKSFFRYRDPKTGVIRTSFDGNWDLRLFHVDPDAPLWHSVYTETHRFSFGYMLVENNTLRRIARLAGSVLGGRR